MTLRGSVADRPTATILERLTSEAPGVAGVRADLHWPKEPGDPARAALAATA